MKADKERNTDGKEHFILGRERVDKAFYPRKKILGLERTRWGGGGCRRQVVLTRLEG